MALTELVYCVTVALTITERTDQLHYDNAPVYSTALVQPFFGKASHHPGLSAPYSPDLAPCNVGLFPKLKITVEREEICECDCNTVHKLSQRRLTAD